MVIKVPEKLFQDFEYISGRNFSSKDNQHVQTIAYIFGEEESPSEIVGNGLLYPDQEGHADYVISKGKKNFCH